MSPDDNVMPPERQPSYDWSLLNRAAQGLGRASKDILGIGPEDFGPGATGGARVRPGVPPAVAGTGGIGVRTGVPQPVAEVVVPDAVAQTPREGAEASLYDKMLRAVQGEAGKWSLGGPEPVSAALEKAFPMAPRGAQLDEVSRSVAPRTADAVGPASEAAPTAPTTQTAENAPALQGAMLKSDVPPGLAEKFAADARQRGLPPLTIGPGGAIEIIPGDPRFKMFETPGPGAGPVSRFVNGPANPAASTQRDLQGPNPLGAGLTALLQDWKPTHPEHQRMATSLLGGDPAALRGFQAALAEGGPDVDAIQARLAGGGGQAPSLMAVSKASLPILPATTSIRELRGNQEGQSTATTVPQGGPGGGKWINPGYPGWEEKNVLPVGGGQYRDYNFGGYGDPYRQQQAAAMQQHQLLQSLGPQGAAHYLAAQMQQPFKSRELDIMQEKVRGDVAQADVAKKLAETQLTQAKAEAMPENLSVQRFLKLQATNPTNDPRQTISHKKTSGLPLTMAEKLVDKGYTDEPYEELIQDKDFTPEELIQHPNRDVAAEAMAALKAQKRGLKLAPSGSQAGFGGPSTTIDALEQAQGEAELKKMQEKQRAQPPTYLDRLILQLFGGGR